MTNPSIFLEGFLNAVNCVPCVQKEEENMKDLTVGKPFEVHRKICAPYDSQY